MVALTSLMMSGREVLPLVEGGKGVAVSNGQSSGAWANAGGIGTFSAVNADTYDKNGDVVAQLYHGKTRRERHNELIQHAIKGGIEQAQIAHETSNGQGRIHMNVLWEMGGVEEIIHGILDKAKNLVHGITCGAGMPYKVAQIASQYNQYYYPIVSSARAFSALWKRAYKKMPEFLGGVVYEDPWLAGGHNGLSNSEDPLAPESPYPRVKALRDLMNSFGLNNTPIIMAGGVWHLREWKDWINNVDLGPIGFQFGTRPLLTQESPISKTWKDKLLTLKKGDVFLNRFSPTGFYSSAVRNPFLNELRERSDRQVTYFPEPTNDCQSVFHVGPRRREVFMTETDRTKAQAWFDAGFTEALRTPEGTMVFVDKKRSSMILKDQQECMGCLSACGFSNWSQGETGTTGRRADPRSFCIQKTLQTISHSDDTQDQLMFAGHAAYKFATDPFYDNGFIPTVKQLFERIKTGD